MGRRIVVAFTAVVLASALISAVYATTFTYRSVSATVSVADIQLVSIAGTQLPLCAGIARSGRVAIVFTDFEAYPLPGWASSGGIWSTAPGFKGNALQGTDNNGGVGRASHYYYNTRLDTYASLWVSVKTRLVSGSGWYGLSLLNAGRNRLYTVEIRTTGYVEVWSYNVERRNGWYLLAQGPIAGYSSTAWYVLVVNYVVTPTSVDFYVWVYDVGGNLVASLTARSTHANRFTPAYIGVEVDDPTALFDDFVISTADPRYVYFTNIPGAGYRVELVDNLGAVVNATTAAGTSASMGVVTDIVVGTGSDGTFRVYYPGGAPCLVTVVPGSDAVVGGDTYAVVWSVPVVDAVGKTVSATIGYGGNRTAGPLFNVTITLPGETRYTYLVLDWAASLVPSTLNLEISLVNAAGTASSAIEIVNGLLVTDPSTSAIPLSGSGNFVNIAGHFTEPSQVAVLKLYIVACSTPTLSVCTMLPVTVNLSTTE